MDISKKSKNTPKDFFLYLSMAVSLYVSAVALIGLWFSYINYLFPDTLRYYSNASPEYQGWMATLFVSFSIFIIFARLVNQGVRKEKSKEDFWVRKWLLYLTLFAAGATLAVDVIVLINSFLGGDLTSQFLLKILVVFVVAAAVFGYFMADIKGFWRQREKESLLYGGIVTLIVLVSIILGFVFFGSPATQRDYRLDMERIGDLESIQWQIVDWWRGKNELPEDLSVLSDDLRGFRVPTDPVTGEEYGYETRGDLTFALCANFAKGSQGLEYRSRLERPIAVDSVRVGFTDNPNWQHPEGRHCFERTIDPDFYETR